MTRGPRKDIGEGARNHSAGFPHQQRIQQLSFHNALFLVARAGFFIMLLVLILATLQSIQARPGVKVGINEVQVSDTPHRFTASCYGSNLPSPSTNVVSALAALQGCHIAIPLLAEKVAPELKIFGPSEPTDWPGGTGASDESGAAVGT